MPGLKKILVCIMLLAGYAHAQSAYTYTVNKTRETCEKALASLTVGGTGPSDSVAVTWSTGHSGTYAVAGLLGGFYSVNVYIKHKKDTTINTHDTTLVFVKDTTIQFAIIKEECKVSVTRFFSPNGDNYNDLVGIGNIEQFPNFEFSVYNRWGQRVHHQENTFKPWDGTWLGIDLPDGAYYFVFFYDSNDRIHVMKGDITLLR